MTISKPLIQKLYSTDSTNNAAFRLLEQENPIEGTVIVSKFQTAGKGQGQSSWSSEAGQNLTFSLILKPLFLEPSRQFLMNQVIALGVRDGLCKLSNGVPFCIKWPNDLIFEKKKIAGILIENRVMGSIYDTAVAGVGININQKEFHPELPNPTSLHLITKSRTDLDEALAVVVENIMHYYNMLKSGKHNLLQENYLMHLLGLNKWNSFEDSSGQFMGKILGTDSYGQLLVEKKNATVEAYEVKEIKMLLG